MGVEEEWESLRQSRARAEGEEGRARRAGVGSLGVSLALRIFGTCFTWWLPTVDALVTSRRC